MNDIECPYCDHGQEVNHDDGAGYEEDERHEMECDECGKEFIFTTCISFDYYPQKADCLNDGKHDLSEWRESWQHDSISCQRRGCKDCDYSEERRVATTNGKIA